MSDAKGLEPFELGAAADDDDRLGADASGEMEVEIVSFGDDDEPAPPAAGAAETSAAQRELAELREQHLRLRADFENYRKRAERDRDERLRRGVAETLRELLPVADNLARALAAAGDVDDVRSGVEMIGRQLSDVLRRHGVEPVAALGEPFDPELHDAVAREENAEVEVPTVIEELQRGYRHGERLLRPAMVRVAMPRPPAASDDGGEAAEPEDEA